MRIKDCYFIAACAPPGGGRNNVTPRLYRHFNMLWIPELSQMSMEIIFHTILKGFLGNNQLTSPLEKFSLPITNATIDAYSKVCKELLPTPTKSHYTFNLRDLSKVF